MPWHPPPPIRVLLCDDHAVVREGLARLLDRTEGIEVVGSAADGEEARRRGGRAAPGRRAHGPRDAEPRRGRRDAADRRPRRPRRSVVVLTSFSDNTRIHDALDAGALGYLLKDAEAAEVVRAIRAASRGEAPARPARRPRRARARDDAGGAVGDDRARARGPRAARHRAAEQGRSRAAWASARRP